MSTAQQAESHEHCSPAHCEVAYAQQTNTNTAQERYEQLLEQGRRAVTEESEGEFPDSYLDRVDGHWYVITYVWNGPQIHALDCETCLADDDS